MKVFALLVIAPLVAFAACTDAKPNKKADPVATAPATSPVIQQPGLPTGTGTGTGVDLTPDCDENKDFHQLEFPQEIKDCLEDGRMYNFDKKKCQAMKKAEIVGEPCTYDEVKAYLVSQNVGTGALDAQKAAGSKMIGCGASNAGDVLVTQHWYGKPSGKDDCTFSNQGKVVSVCFRKFVGGTTPPKPTDEEDYVETCLDIE
jgi:hypothetical protein